MSDNTECESGRKWGSNGEEDMFCARKSDNTECKGNMKLGMSWGKWKCSAAEWATILEAKET